MVPKAGLEPAWITPHAPQTCVSTSSTTSAELEFYYNNAALFKPTPHKGYLEVDFQHFFLQS
jgi:hypothetical protein